MQEESPRGCVQGPDLPGQGAYQAPHTRGEEHDFLSNSCRLLWSDHLKFILWKQFVIFMDLDFLLKITRQSFFQILTYDMLNLHFFIFNSSSFIIVLIVFNGFIVASYIYSYSLFS